MFERKTRKRSPKKSLRKTNKKSSKKSLRKTNKRKVRKINKKSGGYIPRWEYKFSPAFDVEKHVDDYWKIITTTFVNDEFTEEEKSFYDKIINHATKNNIKENKVFEDTYQYFFINENPDTTDFQEKMQNRFQRYLALKNRK